MKKTWILTAALGTGMLLLGSVNALAQQKETPVPASAGEVKIYTMSNTVGGQGEKVPQPVTNTFSFVNSEFAYDGRPVKGSPYSAEAVTETTQVLGDGNRLVNRSTATVYRDSEGRTRREQTLKAIGGVAAAAPLQTIMISDPVAGASYSLDPVTRTARKTSMGSFTLQRSATTPASTSTFVYGGGGAEPSTARIGAGTGTGVGAGGGVAVAPVAPTVVVAPGGTAPSIGFSAQSNAGGGYQLMTRDGRSGNVNKEDLGTQNIEGVEATGTRVTMTIPAGQIGNERPIEIVDERWFSNDLHLFVMTRHSDPRSGETVYRLTNINRSEPDHSLFTVPADYDVNEKTMLPARTRKPDND